MKRQTILLVDADGDCEDAVARAGARSGLSVRWVRTCREAFKFLENELRDLALIVVDLDADSHGMAILEAINTCAECPGVVALTGFEQTYAEPILRVHGVAACLGKPIAIDRLAATIEDVTCHHSPTSDCWGHVQPRTAHGRTAARSAVRGIATKLSPQLTVTRRNI